MNVSRRSNFESSRGYVLMEVLVAATLLGVVLAVLLEGFSMGLDTLSLVRDRWVASILARGEAATSSSFGGQGSFNQPFDRYSWEEQDGQIVVRWSDAPVPGWSSTKKQFRMTLARAIDTGVGPVPASGE